MIKPSLNYPLCSS